MNVESVPGKMSHPAAKVIASELPADIRPREGRTGPRGPTFNRFLYENLISNLESQLFSWNHDAVRNPNPEVAHALWLKAEGLGYALRLLYAFEPEFRELVECASRMPTGEPIQK